MAPRDAVHGAERAGADWVMSAPLLLTAAVLVALGIGRALARLRI
jgi:hypothetical protein